MEQKGSNWIRFAPFLVLAVVLLVVLVWTTRDPGPDGSGTVQETPAVAAPEPGPSMTDLERSWTAATGAPTAGSCWRRKTPIYRPWKYPLRAASKFGE